MKKTPLLVVVATLLFVGMGCTHAKPQVKSEPEKTLDLNVTQQDKAAEAPKVSNAIGGGKEGDDCKNAPPTCPEHHFQECVGDHWKCIPEGGAAAPAPAAPTNAPAPAPATNAPPVKK